MLYCCCNFKYSALLKNHTWDHTLCSILRLCQLFLETVLSLDCVPSQDLGPLFSSTVYTISACWNREHSSNTFLWVAAIEKQQPCTSTASLQRTQRLSDLCGCCPRDRSEQHDQTKPICNTCVADVVSKTVYRADLGHKSLL